MTVKGLLGAALLGGVGYPLLEMVTRGRTHKSMALAGAICLPVIRLCARLPCRRAVRALWAAASVTLCEGIIGAICNRDYRVWDYRHMRGNVGGQVCPAFSLLWYGLSYLLVFRRREARM